MKSAKWIWYYGEFEIYHYLLLNSRREDMGCDYPCLWNLSAPYPRVDFKTSCTIPKDTTLRVVTNGFGMVWFGAQKYPVNMDISIAAGNYDVLVQITKTAGLPGIFIDSPDLKTDASWTACAMGNSFVPVGCSPAFTNAGDNIEIFPFSYQTLSPVCTESINGGMLYDFGKETFARLILECKDPAADILLVYGESKAEALDPDNAILRETLLGQSQYQRPPRAFRYIWIKSKAAVHLTADYEYLPLEQKGAFSCNDPLINQIWNVCRYTFELNSREFYLDGIKRDRWVWSGDAYQSFMVNAYLHFDPQIIKRTIIGLLGKPPYTQHINTINDYSAYLIISVYDYYHLTGDVAFVRSIYDRLQALYSFICERLDSDGLVCERPGDWVFIDWADMDKSGPLCAEQILLWKTHKAMFALSALCDEENKTLLQQADLLQQKVIDRFWDKQKGCFIDCYTSGKNHVSRHANLFAILFDFVDKDKQKLLIQNVLLNPTLPEITTPFFKFFELSALCKCGYLEKAQAFISSYWGGMIKLGATTVWEQYDLKESGDAHYAMYGAKFGKSLCHAWGAGPIYLLGRYCLGVYPTDTAYRTFNVEPNCGIYRTFSGTVPLPCGKVEIAFENEKLTVLSTAAGGTLLWNGGSYPLKKDVPLVLENQKFKL